MCQASKEAPAIDNRKGFYFDGTKKRRPRFETGGQFDVAHLLRKSMGRG